MNFNNISNTALFRLFVENGDNEAISLFFQNQSDLFYRVALKYTKNSADAEDVLQTAFIRISEKAHQYKGLQTDEEKLLQSWCLSIVVHCALKKIQTESKFKRKESSYSNSKPFHEEENMSSQIDKEAVFQKVQNAIVQLPEKFRIPIHLKYIEGFELDAIATILKLNANTLRSNIKRGLEKVSEQLKADNITLSSMGLIGVIETLPLEKAPHSIKALVSKNFNAANSSRRLLAKGGSKIFLHSLPFYGSIVATCLAIAGGIFYWNHSTTPSTITEKKSELSIPKTETSSQIDTNQTWSFKNESDRNLNLLIGNWQWSSEFESMQVPVNKLIMIPFPIIAQEKPFMIEIVLKPYATAEFPNTDNLLRGYWIRNNEVIKHENYIKNDRFIYKNNKFVTERIYFYQGYVCVFRDNQFFQFNRYLEDLKGANVAIVSCNYLFRKIVSKTLNAPPEELLSAIKSSAQLTMNIQEPWPINELNFNIK